MEKQIDIQPVAVSVKVGAKMLGVSPPTLYSWIHQDGFPAFKKGGRTLISVELLKEWVRLQTQSGRRNA